MKFSTLSALVLGAASAVYADTNYFDAPRKHSTFSTSDSITFVVDEVTNDWDDTLRAELYSTEDDTWIETLGEWTGGEISGDDNFVFTWDVDVEEGDYYVRVYEEDNEDNDDQDDVSRSHTFTIGDESWSQSGKAYSAFSKNAQVASTDEQVAEEASTDEQVAEEASTNDAEAQEASVEDTDKVKEASTKDKKIASSMRRKRSIYAF